MIIGITGTLGSGKGTVVEYLKTKYGFKHYSARAFISEEVARRGMPDNRDSMHIVGNELRTQFGPASTVDKLFERALEAGGNGVIESLRAIAEVKALQAKTPPCLVIGVDADQKIRYERTLGRKSSTDNVSYERFIADEAREMSDPDPNGMNIKGCLEACDVIIDNSGDLESLYNQIDDIIKPH